MIRCFPALVKVPNKVVVHDAAANMKAAIPAMEVKASSLLCADHLLNTALLHACSKVLLLDEAIQCATALSSKVHQSTLACKALKDECIKLGVDYVKIIAPVATRWNSNHLMIDSMLKVRPALRSLREDKDMPYFRGVIPSDNQFDILESVNRVLKMMKQMSDEWSKDNEPVMQMMLASFHFIDTQLTQICRVTTSATTKEFCKHLATELFKETRIANKGNKNIFLRENNIYAVLFRENNYY